MKYQGMTAMITGASSGLGEAFARQLATQGANLGPRSAFGRDSEQCGGDAAGRDPGGDNGSTCRSFVDCGGRPPHRRGKEPRSQDRPANQLMPELACSKTFSTHHSASRWNK